MVVYPETQRRAQEEIDRVVGRDRLPSFDDFEDMPYVRAMVCNVSNRMIYLTEASPDEGSLTLAPCGSCWVTASFHCSKSF